MNGTRFVVCVDDPDAAANERRAMIMFAALLLSVLILVLCVTQPCCWIKSLLGWWRGYESVGQQDPETSPLPARAKPSVANTT